MIGQLHLLPCESEYFGGKNVCRFDGRHVYPLLTNIFSHFDGKNVSRFGGLFEIMVRLRDLEFGKLNHLSKFPNVSYIQNNVFY